MKVFIYVQKLKHEDKGIFRGFLTELKNNNIDIHVKIDEVENDTAFNFEEIKVVEWRGYEDIKEKRPNFIITLGGDGTMLQAVTLIRDSRIPVLGINLGRLGFLASVEKKFITNAVYQLMNGMYRIEERTLLHLDCNKPIFGNTPIALNDFTILKRDNSSMITIHTYVNGDFLNSYWADGIIIATPTGSTGYSLSCGGPILFPQAKNFIITPVAAHNLNVRPVVLPDEVVLSFKVEGRTDTFLCTMDSRYEIIDSSFQLAIRKADYSIKLVQLQPVTFLKTLHDKMNWGLDQRN
ncbi:MAG TPA: NAD kinase [Saprospiraceae bacterium]|jgi:NAD+ kinase|nr:NAD kinase [Saprospiraceae bacterium]HUN15184.1 NAD kinase [Saprospiraceae bacterium]